MLDDRLVVGSIIFEHVTDTIPPKEKYYIVVGTSSDQLLLGTVYINSTINPQVFHTQRLRDLHIPISPSDNPFLSHDSFVDCSRINEKPVEKVTACLDSGNNKYGYYGGLDPRSLHEVLSTLQNAPTIKKAIKDKYLR